MRQDEMEDKKTGKAGAAGVSGYSKASFLLSAVPLAVLLIVFLVCLIISGGEASDNDRGAIWWLFLAALWVVGPVAAVTDILSVIFGIIGLKRRKTRFAWAGIGIVVAEIAAVLLIWAFVL